MHRYVALLRGIAPSVTNMSNDKLRGVHERLGFEHVGSVLASGNIVFRSTETDVPALERHIEEALTSELGLKSRVIVRSLEELRALLASDPFPGLTHGRGTYLTATFLKDHLGDEDRSDIASAGGDQPPDVRGYDEAARVVLAVTDNTEEGRTPAFMTWLERTYGTGITTRSWLTVQRIVTKLEA